MHNSPRGAHGNLELDKAETKESLNVNGANQEGNRDIESLNRSLVFRLLEGGKLDLRSNENIFSISISLVKPACLSETSMISVIPSVAPEEY